MEKLKIITERVDGARSVLRTSQQTASNSKKTPSRGRKAHSTKKVFEKKEKKHIV